jgi:hypothetical protein
MSKLDTLRRNLKKHPLERDAAAAERLRKSWVEPVQKPRDPFDQIMAPPRCMLDQYRMVLTKVVSERIIGDSTMTREQQRVMMEDTLNATYREIQVSGSLTGIMNNRSTTWKPKVEDKGISFEVHIGNTWLASIH